MPQPPEWTQEEFERLIRAPQLNDEVMAAQLPLRTAGAVGSARAAVHEYHARGSDGTFNVPRKFLAFLESHRGEWVCAVCRERF
jgi:hypothetical protein